MYQFTFDCDEFRIGQIVDELTEPDMVPDLLARGVLVEVKPKHKK